LSFTVANRDVLLADVKGNLVSAPGLYKIMFTNGVDQSVVKTMKLQGSDKIVDYFPKGANSEQERLSVPSDTAATNVFV